MHEHATMKTAFLKSLLSFVFMRVLHYWYLEINLEICLKTRKFHELARRQLERLVVDFQRWFMQWWYSFKGGERHTLKSFENRHHLCINSGRWVDRQTGWQVNNNKNLSTWPLSTQRLFDLSTRRYAAIDLLNLTFSNYPIYFIFIFQFVKTLKNYFQFFQ